MLAFPELGENFTLQVSSWFHFSSKESGPRRKVQLVQTGDSKKKNESNRIEGEWDGNGAGERKKRMLQFC